MAKKTGKQTKPKKSGGMIVSPRKPKKPKK